MTPLDLFRLKKFFLLIFIYLDLIKNLKKISIKMSAEESTSLNIKNNETTFDNLQKNSEQVFF